MHKHLYEIWLAEKNANAAYQASLDLISTAKEMRQLLNLPVNGFTKNQMRLIQIEHSRNILENTYTK